MLETVLAQGQSASGGKNKIFSYSVLVLNVLTAWGSWWVLGRAFSGASTHSWIYPALAFGSWGIAFTLAVIFVRKKTYLYVSFALGFAVYPLFFGFNLSLVGALLAFLIFLLTENQTKKEISQGIRLNFYRLIGRTLKYFVTAVCLAISVAYYFSLVEKSAIPSTTFLENETLQVEMDLGLKAAGFVMPEEKKTMVEDITNGMSVDNFLSKNFVQPEAEEAVTAELGNASDTTKMIGNAAALEVQQQLLAKSKRDLAKQLGVDVVGEQPMKNVLMAYIDKTERSFFEYSGTDKFYVPIILALGIFLTARILGTVVEIILGLFILLLIKILRTTGIVELGSEQKKVAVIEYSV